MLQMGRFVVGLLLMVTLNVAGAVETRRVGGALVTSWDGAMGGFTLAPFAFVGIYPEWRREYERHEVGHVAQAWDMGRGYLAVELLSLAFATGCTVAMIAGADTGDWYDRLPWELDATRRGRALDCE